MRSVGIMEYWSSGVMKNTSTYSHSNTPILHDFMREQ